MQTENRSLDVEFVVRGGSDQDSIDLRRRVIAWAGEAVRSPAAPFHVTARTYTQQAERLEGDLRRASLVLMPSRAEAFGLVGAEAIEYGVPTLVSHASGLGFRLRSAPTERDADWFVVGADPTDPTQPWEWHIRQILQNPPTAFQRIENLRRRLVVQRPWATVAAELLAAVGPAVPASPMT